MKKKMTYKMISIVLLPTIIMTHMSGNVVFAEEAQKEAVLEQEETPVISAEGKEVIVVKTAGGCG